MPWPREHRHYEFSAGHPVPSVTLNEMQDKLVDLHRQKHKWLTVLQSFDNRWKLKDGVWIAQGKEPLCVYPDLAQSAFIEDITIKYYYTGIVTSSSDLKLELIEYEPNFDRAVEPSLRVVDQEIVKGDVGWKTKVFKYGKVVDENSQVFVRIWDGSKGDKVAGVLMSYYLIAYE